MKYKEKTEKLQKKVKRIRIKMGLYIAILFWITFVTMIERKKLIRHFAQSESMIAAVEIKSASVVEELKIVRNKLN